MALRRQWNLDENGRRRFFQGRNREERDIAHDEHHPSLDLMLQNGEHAVPLAESFDEYLKANEYTFVNFVSRHTAPLAYLHLCFATIASGPL